MIARSLLEVYHHKGKIAELVLTASSDLVCNNLWCEKVTLPCICRLEKVLQSVDVATLKRLDLSNNGLSALPPSIAKLTGLKELNLSGNKFQGVVPAEVKAIEGNLDRLIMEDN